MTSFRDLEASIESSQPREYCRIAYGTTEHLIAFADRDIVTAEGKIYKAVAADRGQIAVAGAGKSTALELTLPLDHAFVKRYLSQGTPPRLITFTLWRQQADGSVEQQFVGEITSMNVDDDNTSAVFRVPSRASESLLRVIPNVTCGKTCPHMLFDSMCKVERVLGTTYFSTTVTSKTGREIRLSLAAPFGPYRSDWAEGGEVHHPSSGERMTVIDQADDNPGVLTTTTLTQQAPIVEMKVGDTVEVYAGCDHTLETCVNKFNNRQNFGGLPHMQKANPFVPGTGSEAL